MKLTIPILLISLFCLNSNIHSQNAPITTAGDYTTYETSISVPITVENFNNILAYALKLEYDESILVATDVTIGPTTSGTLTSNITNPGTIIIGWYTYLGVDLPDSTIIFNIVFSQVSAGTSSLTWIDDGNSCSYYDEDYNDLNDLPTSTYYIDGSVTFLQPIAPITSLPDITICENSSSIDIPITVSAFNSIGAFDLSMQYDASVLNYQSFTNNSGFSGLNVTETSPGTIVAEGLSTATEGISLANNTVLYTVHFTNQGGSTGLTWFDNGESCEYLGSAPSYNVLNDEPQSAHYINGYFTELTVPSPAGNITGSSGGTVCQGESDVIFSIPPITFANSYIWTLPAGATITNGEGTSEITVSFNMIALGGDVSVYGTNECGNGEISPSFPLFVDMAPSISIQPVSPDTVYAGNGIALFSITTTGSNLAFQWQEYINDWADVYDGGVYSGTLTDILTITNPPVSMNENKYRCIVSGSCEPQAISDGNAMLYVVLNTGFDNPTYEDDPENDRLKFKAFPNPFSEQITFSYVAPSKGTILIEIRNIFGEKIVALTNPFETKGNHLLPFNTRQLRPGIYAATIRFYGDKGIVTSTLKIISNNK